MMTRRLRITLAGLTAGALAMPMAAAAQDGAGDLLTMGQDELRPAVQMRYDAGLAASLDPAIIAANDSRFIWANEAKAQCAIAMGYLKSSTRDETSLGKCDYAYRQLLRVPRDPVAPPPPPPPPAQVCRATEPALVFFEFDSAFPTTGADETINFVIQNAADCGWRTFTVIGHTDRAGSNAYNDALAMRRAQAVANTMAGSGIGQGALTVTAMGEEQPRVPTADGVRNPQNRRVEITASR